MYLTNLFIFVQKRLCKLASVLRDPNGGRMAQKVLQEVELDFFHVLPTLGLQLVVQLLGPTVTKPEWDMTSKSAVIIDLRRT